MSPTPILASIVTDRVALLTSLLSARRGYTERNVMVIYFPWHSLNSLFLLSLRSAGGRRHEVKPNAKGTEGAGIT